MMDIWSARLDVFATTLTVDCENFAVVSVAYEMGVRLRWTAEQDACDACMELDGEIYDADDASRPPLHPNCRCQLVFAEGFEGGLVYYNASIFADADKDHFARIYLIDTSVCGNAWQVTDAALERAAKSLIGKSLMVGHGAPKGSEIGVFVDYLKEDGHLFGLAKITDEEAWKHIAAGEWSAVSVELLVENITCSECGADVTNGPDAHILNRTGHEVIEDFEFVNIAMVESPAYPRAKVEEVDGHHDVWPPIATFSTSSPPLTCSASSPPLTFSTSPPPTVSASSPPPETGIVLYPFRDNTTEGYIVVHNLPSYSDFSRLLTAELGTRRIAQTLAPEDTAWDLTAAGTNDLPDSAFAWINPDYPEKSYFAEMLRVTMRKLPHHKMVGGTLKVVWRGVAAAMAVLLGARGGVDLPRDDKRKVYEHLAAHYRQFDKEAPVFESEKKGGNKVTDETEKRIAELEQKATRIAELDKQVETLTKIQTEMKAKLDEPAPKVKAGVGDAKIEETRERLFGYRRTRLASDGGTIIR